MNPAWPTKGDVEITYLIHFISFYSYDPELFTHSAAWIRGSRTQTSRQMVNLLDECHGECIGY